MARSAFDDRRLTAVGLLLETSDGLLAKLGPDLEERGLTTSEFGVLLRLARSPGERLRMTDLAAQVGLSTSGLTRLVDRLERDDLVKRESCPSDRRGAFAVLTDEGRARMQEAIAPHLTLIDEWFTGLLGRKELDALCDSLRKVRDRVRPAATAGSAPPATARTAPGSKPARPRAAARKPRATSGRRG